MPARRQQTHIGQDAASTLARQAPPTLTKTTTHGPQSGQKDIHHGHRTPHGRAVPGTVPHFGRRRPMTLAIHEQIPAMIHTTPAKLRSSYSRVGKKSANSGMRDCGVGSCCATFK